MFSFSLVNRRGKRKEKKNEQMEGTPSAPLSDNGEKAEPITAEHKGQTDRRGMCKKKYKELWGLWRLQYPQEWSRPIH